MEMNNCIFCKIANGEIPAQTIYEDESFRVILDLAPASKGHALILPKQHSEHVCDAKEEVLEKILPLAGKIGKAAMASLGATGFNVIQNNGSSAGQTVFHLHVHVIPRYEDTEQILTWSTMTPDEGELQETAQKIKALLSY